MEFEYVEDTSERYYDYTHATHYERQVNPARGGRVSSGSGAGLFEDSLMKHLTPDDHGWSSLGNYHHMRKGLGPQ